MHCSRLIKVDDTQFGHKIYIEIYISWARQHVKNDGLWKIQVSDDLNVLVLGYLYCNEYLLYTRAALDTRINKKLKKVLKAE